MPMQRERLPKSRSRSIEFYSAYLEDAAKESEEALRLAKRWLARNDLFFLLTVICKRKDMNNDWLFDRCREVELDPNGHLDAWARDHYKALALDTPIWTPGGWKNHGDLKPGDLVFSPNGEPVKVIANTGPMEGADCYLVNDVVAAGDHLWPAQIKHRKRCGDKRVVWHSTEKVRTRDMGRIRLPNVSPLQGASGDLPIPPYVLGAWLGDGHSADGRLTNADEEIWDLLGWEARQTSVDITRTLLGLRPLLREVGVLGNKHVPDAYLRAGPADRLALLQGLMDTDGHANERGTATFVNTNENLVDSVLFLVRSLGGRANKRRYENGGNGFWQVSFQAKSGDYCAFRLNRKRDRCYDTVLNMRTVEPKPTETVTVNCIQVEGGLYLAGKELLPTHNSTIITFGLTLQDVLASHGDDPEPRYNGREVTFGFFSVNKSVARAFLRQIQQECENNRELYELFPEILWENPKNDAWLWSVTDGLKFKRKTNPKEATIEANGLVDGMPTSKHYTHRVYDDVVTDTSVTSPEMIKKTTTAWELSDNLGTEDGVFRIIGTYYAMHDTYRVMKDRGVPVREKPCTSDGSEDFSKSVFRSPEHLAAKRRLQGPYTFGCQMLLNPTADTSQGFNMDWLQYWPAANLGGLNIYIVVDPATSKKKTSDYTVMWVVGVGGDKNYYLIDGVRDRLNLAQRTRTLFSLVEKYKPLAVGYEQYGAQSDIEHMEGEMERTNYRFRITPLGGRIAKEDRIKRMVPLFEGGRFYFIEGGIVKTDYEGKSVDIQRQFIQEEYEPFPVVTHDDGLDGLARILEEDLGVVFPQPIPEQKPKWMLDLELETGSAGSWKTA